MYVYITNVSTTQWVILTRWRSHVAKYHQLTVKHYAKRVHVRAGCGAEGGGEHWVIHEQEFVSD